MFGYIMTDKPELKVKEFYRYKGYYCGLCHALRREYGFRGRMTLTYDMTFLVLFLTSLYEPETRELQEHCPIHPVKKIPMLQNEISEYGAKMNILLTYFKFEDDWKDDKSLQGAAGMRLFRKKTEKICREYKRQAHAVQKQLKILSAYEEKQEENLDLVAGAFGCLMAELFVYRQDIWEEDLRKFGFYLGKFIYILDAYDDLEEDLKTGSYNPLKTLKKQCEDLETYEQRVKEILLMMMAEATAVFEKLPCLLDAEILRNILYSGVWSKYNKIQKERQEKRENHGK
ncbi:MAG: DUF5685 family protein [Blautia sp.]|uniref:Uncharacterized protein n=1 Tax=Blautia argi TaxID=1912897 RepID=A0A2Z4UC46_9FIRM|nr:MULTISPECIES: DUF5685 family protein [Blautia]AWY98640.1 hypothetical protein DQQ01_11275 [Blautia argi]